MTDEIKSLIEGCRAREIGRIRDTLIVNAERGIFGKYLQEHLNRKVKTLELLLQVLECLVINVKDAPENPPDPDHDTIYGINWNGGFPPLVWSRRKMGVADQEVKPDVVIEGEPQKAPSFIWQNRLVEIRDGMFALSHWGKHDLFDFHGSADWKRAIIGHPSGTVLEIQQIDDSKLRLICSNGNFVLSGGGEGQAWLLEAE